MAAPSYIGWKEGLDRFFDVDPDVAHREIEAIASNNGGVASPDSIVEASRSDNAVLHSCFEWDDSVAAQNHRKAQARALINSIEVSYQEAPKVKSKAFEVATLPEAGRGYQRTDLVMSNHEQKAELMRRALRELQSMQKRYAALTELQSVFAAAEEIMTRQGVAGQ